MNLGRYLVGVGELALVLGALAYGAARLRARFLADWSGAPARLAELVIALSAQLIVLEAVGAAQILDPVPIVLASLGVGVAMAWAGRPLGGGDRPAPPPQMGAVATAIALAVIMLVAIHWASGAEHSFSVGLYEGDENWYHLPYPARFAQEGSITALHFASPNYLSWFHPLNSELFHGMGMVLFGRDIASPFLNLVWLAVALLAAWCIGRPFGVAPLTAAAAALALDLPVFSETQAGSAMSDLFGVTFLLVAVAILINGSRSADGERRELEPAVLAVAGLAAGLALGGKLSFAGPVAVLLVGAVAFAPAGARPRTAALFGLPLIATGSFWYLRDLWHTGNPFPYVQEIGPIDLPGPGQELSEHPFSVAHYLFDGSVWSDFFVPGLEDRIGPIWFLLIGIALTGIAAALAQRRSRALTVFGAAAAVSFAFYLLTPAAAEGPEGMPREFTAGLRVFEPALTMGLVLAAVAVAPLGRRARWTALAASATATLVATGREASFWESGGQLAAAILIASALIQRRGRTLTMFGAAAAVALLFYMLTPAGAEGPEGMPREFTAGLRVFEPPLVMGLVLAAIAVGGLGPRARWIALVAAAVATVVATDRELSFWESDGQLAGAVLVASALILLPLGLIALARRGARGPATAAVAGALALLVVIAVGWSRTEAYLDHRYRTDDAPEYFKSLSLVPVYRWASDLEDQRIGTSGILQYGLYGEDLSNHVQFLGEVGSDESFREITNCPDWRRAVNEGDYDYVVAMPRYGGTRRIQARWTRGTNAEEVLRSGPITVFRLTGTLDPADCGTLPTL